MVLVTKLLLKTQLLNALLSSKLINYEDNAHIYFYLMTSCGKED